MPRFSKRAKRHAAESKQRTKRMLRDAHTRSGPVTVSYLPGFEPPSSRARFPFSATINGRHATVWPDWIEYEDDDDDGPPAWWHRYEQPEGEEFYRD